MLPCTFDNISGTGTLRKPFRVKTERGSPEKVTVSSSGKRTYLNVLENVFFVVEEYCPQFGRRGQVFTAGTRRTFEERTHLGHVGRTAVVHDEIEVLQPDFRCWKHEPGRLELFEARNRTGNRELTKRTPRKCSTEGKHKITRQNRTFTKVIVT